MPKRLDAILDRLDRFLERYLGESRDENLVLLVALLAFLGMIPLADAIAGGLGVFVGLMLGLLLFGILILLSFRDHPREKRERRGGKEYQEEVERRRLPRDFLAIGGISLAIPPFAYVMLKYVSRAQGEYEEHWWLYTFAIAEGISCFFVGVAGLFDRRICLVISYKHRRKVRQPVGTRIIAWTLLWSGFALGGYLGFLWYH